jgi:hypothetical protein
MLVGTVGHEQFVDRTFQTVIPCGILSHVDARLCNGSTTDFESVCLGSNPSLAANFFRIMRTRAEP